MLTFLAIWFASSIALGLVIARLIASGKFIVPARDTSPWSSSDSEGRSPATLGVPRALSHRAQK